jgi:plasmid replication initiation protein
VFQWRCLLCRGSPAGFCQCRNRRSSQYYLTWGIYSELILILRYSNGNKIKYYITECSSLHSLYMNLMKSINPCGWYSCCGYTSVRNITDLHKPVENCLQNCNNYTC